MLPSGSFFDAVHREVLNGENTFNFTVPVNNTDTVYVEEGNYVGFKDLDSYWQVFEIKRIVDLHGDDLIRTAYCEHIFYELIDDIVTDKRPSADATSALDGMLHGTRWQVGIVDDLGASNCNAYYEPALSAVQKVANAWQGELRWRIIVSNNQITERKVDLLAMRGTDTGKQFAYSKDILSIEREIDTSNIATALYGRGKGVELDEGSYGRRLTFADIEDAGKPLGQEWVGDDEALARWGRNGRHRFDVFIDEDETDPVKLLEKTRAELARRKEPRITYRLDAVNLEELSGYEHEKVRLGDLVRVIDREFKPELVVSARVIELERDILDPANTKVVLGSFAPTIVEATINIQRQINEMSSKPYNTKWLDGVIDVLQNAIENTQSYVFQTAEEGILILDAPDYEQATQAMKLGGGIFALANQKDGNGGWNWRTFGTGSGFTADEITAGKIRADLVEIGPETTFAAGYDPSQIEGASDPVRVDKRCKALFHFDGSVNDVSGITPTFTRNSVAYTSDGKKVDAGVPRFEQGKFGQGVFIEEGTTNLLTENQSSAEIDTSGIGGAGATLTRVQRETLFGSYVWKAEINSTAPSRGLYTTIRVPISQGKDYTFQARIECASRLVRFNILFWDTTGIGVVANILSDPFVPNGLTGEPHAFTVTAPTGAVYADLRIVTDGNGVIGDVIYADGLQFEEKPYNTTFVTGTRQNETLEISNPNILNQNEGTVLFWAKLNGLYRKRRDLFETNVQAVGVTRIILGFDIVAEQGLELLWRPTNDAVTGISITAPTVPRPIEEYALFGFTYRRSSENGYDVGLVYNGEIIKTVTTTNGLLNPINSIKLGGNAAIVKANAFFDELAIFDYAATDEEIQAWYEADAPFYRLDLPDPSLPGYVKAESDGLKVYDSQDQLRVLLGSWLDSAVRKYGLKVVGGEIHSSEIYGTSIQSGQEGDKSYIKLGSGWEPLLVRDDGKDALYIWVEGSGNSGGALGGMIVFCSPQLGGAIMGTIHPFNSGGDNGLSINARTGAGFYDRDLKLTAKDIELEVSGHASVSKDLWVSGALYKSSLHYVEPTENYGIRLLNAVETPEMTYFDRGRARLEEGEKIVYLDPIFLETIEPDTDLTPWTFNVEVYGEGEDIRVVEWGENYFRVKECNGGRSNRMFGWWLYATRINHAGIRLMELVKGVN